MAESFRFCNPCSPEDYMQLYGVMDSAFKGEDVASIVRRFVENHPEMTDRHYLMVKHCGKAVAGLLLIPEKWSIEGVEFKVAEMGCVGTTPEYRRRGLQSILNEKFDEYASENGFDLCVLAGIPYFYRQFGYQYAVELDYLTEIDVNKLPSKLSLSFRPFEDYDIHEAQKLFEKTQSGYLVHSIRTDEIWQMQQKTGTYGAEPFNGTVILDVDEVVGYYRFWADKDQKTLVIKELAQRDEAHSEEISAVIREEAGRQGLEKVKSKLSHLDAFSQYLVKLGAKTNKPYAWQVKILDMKGFLVKLGPVLERRLENSEFKGLTMELKMNFWKYALSLRFEDGKLVSVEEVSDAGRTLGLNPYAAIQLFLGYRCREDLEYAYPDFYVRDGLDALIDVLFPRKPGYIHYCY
jgi:predicted acetyltransferase